MKAVIFREYGGIEKLLFEDVPDPKISDDEVLIAVKSCSINHLDIWVRQGIPAYRPPFPHISGCDISGVVEAVGSASISKSIQKTITHCLVILLESEKGTKNPSSS